MRNLIKLFSTPILSMLVFCSFFTSSLFANEITPYKALEEVGNRLFTRIAENQQEIEKFPDVMRQIVAEELMPSIDYKYAAYLILGNKLSDTTKEQRAKFVESMRSNLIRTYANALAKYKNQHVKYEADKPTKGKKIVTVSTQIIDNNKPTINIDFKMRQNKKTKQWKTFDMIVEGISLLSAKQAELRKRITRSGVDQVTLELASIGK